MMWKLELTLRETMDIILFKHIVVTKKLNLMISKGTATLFDLRNVPILFKIDTIHLIIIIITEFYYMKDFEFLPKISRRGS